MKTLLTDISQIVTVDTGGKNFKRGKEMSDLSLLENHSILIEDGKILDFISNFSSIPTFDKIISCNGKVVLPGFVECHTHALFAGSRADEFVRKLNGATYEEIAKAGGGILTTVNSVRNSSFPQLSLILKKRINSFIKQGVTSIEIKSGYGLNLQNEIKMLEVINGQKKSFQINIVPTFLGAHTFPEDFKTNHPGYIREIIDKMLPLIEEKNLAVFCDAFCESTAFNKLETEEIFSASTKHNLKLKIHTEQFNNIGGLELALEQNCTSIDHLEVITDEQISLFRDSDSVAVLLPGVSYFLNYQFAPARKIIDADGIVALATDYNPGSSHISKISYIMSLAALKMNIKPEEIISAYTINAAKAIGKDKNCGSIEIGKDADFAILNCDSYNDLIYDFSNELNYMTISKGEIIYKNELEN